MISKDFKEELFMEEVTLGKTRLGTLWKYVFPAILTNACIFLFTIICSWRDDICSCRRTNTRIPSR